MQGDQSALAQAVHGIEQQFGLSDQVVGLIPLIMAGCASLGAIPIGVLADRRRRTWVLAGVCALWAFAMGAGALAATVAVLFTARLVTGAAEGTPPVAISLLSDYFPVRRRSEAMGVYQAGAVARRFHRAARRRHRGPARRLALGVLDLGADRPPRSHLLPVRARAVRGHQDARFEAELARRSSPARPPTRSPRPKPPPWPPAALLTLPEPRHGPPPPAVRRVAQGGAALPDADPLDVVRHAVADRLPAAAVRPVVLGVAYFERVHHLGPALAGALVTVLGAGSAVGVLAGGYLADRLLRHGHVNARVYVVAYGSIGATLVLAPAFATTNLWLGAPLIFLGGIMLTLPIAPAEALLHRRGTARPARPRRHGPAGGAHRLLRRAVPDRGGLGRDRGALGRPASTVGLHWAIVSVCPLYALGGLIMLLAVRHYPRDIAYVVANARARSAEDAAAAGQPAAPDGFANGQSPDMAVPDPRPVPGTRPAAGTRQRHRRRGRAWLGGQAVRAQAAVSGRAK